MEPSELVLRLSALRAVLPPGVDVAGLCALRPTLLLEKDSATTVQAGVAAAQKLLPEVRGHQRAHPAAGSRFLLLSASTTRP